MFTFHLSLIIFQVFSTILFEHFFNNLLLLPPNRMCLFVCVKTIRKREWTTAAPAFVASKPATAATLFSYFRLSPLLFIPFCFSSILLFAVIIDFCSFGNTILYLSYVIFPSNYFNDSVSIKHAPCFLSTGQTSSAFCAPFHFLQFLPVTLLITSFCLFFSFPTVISAIIFSSRSIILSSICRISSLSSFLQYLSSSSLRIQSSVHFKVAPQMLFARSL